MLQWAPPEQASLVLFESHPSGYLAASKGAASGIARHEKVCMGHTVYSPGGHYRPGKRKKIFKDRFCRIITAVWTNKK
jgi:hypothetical protein